MIAHCIDISSVNDSGIDVYRTMKRPLEHRRQGIFIAEGSKVALRFLESGLGVTSLLLTKEWFDLVREAVEKRPEPVTVFIAEKKLLETIVGFQCHQGIMAAGTVPPAVTLDAMTRGAPTPRFIVAVDRITSAENTGVLVRNCAACGVQALIVGETSADPYLRRAVRNSMGTIFKLPIIYSADLAETLRQLRGDYGFEVIAAHPRSDSTLLFETDFAKDCCIVFGSEGEGISEGILAVCDRTVTIPMAPGIDSFNVACAGAVVLYEAMRQRMNNLKE